MRLTPLLDLVAGRLRDMRIGRVEDQHAQNRLALLDELRRAIDRHELLLHYQPKLDLHDGSLVGVEALVRWQHPQRGFLPPSEFIPLAEQSGLISALSRWVLEAALKQHRVWLDAGMAIPVAVNLSRRMLCEPRLAQTVADVLRRWQVAPEALVLEIPESSLAADVAGVRQNLDGLRALGVRTAIDDFGTGYSSLAALKNLSVDELKIDASFVQTMATDASARGIVRAIIELADALQLQVVAEGVEDQATWDLLAGLGCDVAQGYFLGPPMGADELKLWITERDQSSLEIAAAPRARDPLQERIRVRGARLTAEEEFVARKQTEAALGASEERNRLALQAASMGTWDVDTVSGVHVWSPESEALFGLPAGAFAGGLAVFSRAVHPDDWPVLDDAWQAAIAARRDFTATYRAVWPDGTTHWIEDKGRPRYGSDGKLVRVIGTSMDITERKQAEAALLASEERFRRQYKGFPLPTFSWLQSGDDFVLQDFNDAAEAATQGHIVDFIGSLASVMYQDDPQIVTDLRQCLAEQRTVRREIRYHFRSVDVERDLAVSYVFVPPLTVMLHTEDITEAKQAEQQREAMAQSEKLRAVGQMATGIAHDLNQSLMLVASYSGLARQALLQHPPDLAELEDLLTTTTQAALDGGDTVKRLLLFARADPKQEGTRVDLARLVRDAAQLTAPRWRDAAQKAGWPISLHIEALGQPTIQGSPARLRELMTNLIFNAVDALSNGGAIHLRVLAVEHQAVIEVIDSGVGMTAEVQERVFEPFFTTKGASGTGLGLAMVFGIVEQHHGHIEVHSTPGVGTTFRISFPLLEPSSPDEATPAALGQLESPHPLRVLMVDDEPMMTRAVVRMLRPSGHAVNVAASGEEALEKLSQQPYDVVVSDMGMGAGMNGWELADAVRRGWPGVRFLLATGWGASIDPREAKEKGVEAVLSKPYQLVDLLGALARTDSTAA